MRSKAFRFPDQILHLVFSSPDFPLFVAKQRCICYSRLLCRLSYAGIFSYQSTPPNYTSKNGCVKKLGQIVAQFAAADGMAQLAQSFGLDLADTLAGDSKVLADLFQGMAGAVGQAKAHLQYLPLTLA